MLPLLLVLFIVVPILELYVILQIGQAIGVLPTVALLILDSVLGSVLMRTQGRAVWRRFNQALAEHRLPHREVTDGVLVILGGALLLAPGFVTDVFGALLLLPPTRAVIRGLLGRRLLPRMVAGSMGGGMGGPWTRPPRGPADGDVEGTATEAEPRRLP